jgi:antitoxin (DNA-binding transcriptional repressor) of toxin-antitoxin stability system
VYAWCTLKREIFSVATTKVGVREFRENIATYLESDKPVAITRHGETLGIFVPTPRPQGRSEAEVADLKAAADRLAAALADVDEEEFVAEFEKSRKAAKRAVRA